MADPDKSTAVRHRLLVLASTYPRWSGDHEPGFVHELNRRLAETFEVHVVCPHAPGASRHEVLDGVTVHRFRYAPDGMEALVQEGGILTNLQRYPWKWCLVPPFLFALLLASAAEIRRVKPQSVHAHWIVPQGLALALLDPFFRNLPPFLLTSHGGDLFGLRGRLFGALKRWVLGRARAVTVVSRPMVAEVVRLGADFRRVSVMPMGVDFDERFSLDSSVPRVAGQILFVGRLVEKKGVKYLIQALPEIRKRVPHAHTVIVGTGPELEGLVTLASSLGLQDWVEFLGARPQTELAQFYRRAAVFVAPFVNASSGDREGLGLVTAEAIACGCPVVVGDVPVVSDIFLDTEMDMRAIPGNVESLALKVTDVLLDPERATTSVLVVRRRLIAQLGWNAVVARYVDLLREVAGESSSTSES